MTPVRFSTLKHIAKSPAHYSHAATCERPDSAAMRRGRLVHWNLLGAMPDDEDGQIHVYDGERRGKAWQDFAAAHEGDEIVTAKEWSAAMPIVDAVRAHRHAARIIGDAKTEQRIEWAIAGRACRSTLDVLGKDYIADLKTTTDASPAGFARQAWKMGYHAQLAFYADAARFAGHEVRDVYLIAVEVNAPYPVTVLRLSPALIEEGRRAYVSWFERLRVCEEANHWPAYTEHIELLDVPAWFEGEADDEGEEVEAA